MADQYPELVVVRRTRERDELLAALKACIEAHCRDDKFYCGACTPARAVIARIEAQS